MRARILVASLGAIAAAAVPALNAASRIDPPPRSAWAIDFGPLPWRAARACATLQNRVAFPVLCPRALPRAVVGYPGQLPPSLVTTPVCGGARNGCTGLDFSYGVPWETPGWRRHAWRNRPCCFLHLTVERLVGRVPTGAHPIVLGGHRGRVLPAESSTFYGGLYFGNHVRFFFRERRTAYVATLHTFGNRQTTALLGRIVRGLRPGPFGGTPRGIALKEPHALVPTRGGVWTTSIDPSRLVLVDEPGTIASFIRLHRFVPLDASLNGSSLWVAGYWGPTNAARRIDVQTGRAIATARTGGFAKAVVASGTDVWVINSAPFYRRGSLVRIDPRSNRVTTRIALGRAPARLAVGPDAVWVTGVLDGTLTRVGRRPPHAVTRIRLGGSPYGVALGAGSVWVTDSDGRKVWRIDPRTRHVVATIAVGRNPYGIAAGAGSIWVASVGSGTLARVDPRTNRVIARLPVRGGPIAVAVGGRSVWALSSAEGTLVRARLRRFRARELATARCRSGRAAACPRSRRTRPSTR